MLKALLESEFLLKPLCFGASSMFIGELAFLEGLLFMNLYI